MILVWEHWKFLEKLSARERVTFGQMIVLANLIEVSILHSEKTGLFVELVRPIFSTKKNNELQPTREAGLKKI